MDKDNQDSQSPGMQGICRVQTVEAAADEHRGALVLGLAQVLDPIHLLIFRLATESILKGPSFLRIFL